MISNSNTRISFTYYIKLCYSSNNMMINNIILVPVSINNL